MLHIRGVKFALVILCAAALPAFAQTNLPPASNSAVDENLTVMQHVEELRANCIKNRRIICGKIIKVLPDGIVVDSGYTNLMRAPLTQSWLIPGSAAGERATNFVERSEPDAICFGRVFVTDLPKTPPGKAVHVFDYVILEGFPMGQYTYTSVGTVEHTVRKFSNKITTVVRWMYGQELNERENAKGPPSI